MTESELADFQASLLGALFELEEAGAVRSRLADYPGAEYLQMADDEMIEVAAELVKTWGKIDQDESETLSSVAPSESLFSRLKQIKVSAPEDFTENLDAYLSDQSL